MDSFLQKKIDKSDSALLVINSEGIILAANEHAARLLQSPVKDIINSPVWTPLNLESYAYKKFVAKSRQVLRNSEPDIPQDINCLERKDGIPRFSLDITFCQAKYQSQKIYFLKIKDSLPQKQIEWVLFALQEISLYLTPKDTIDEILKLANQFYQADLASISLLMREQLTTISLYKDHEKLANIALRYHGSHYEKASLTKEIDYCPSAANQYFSGDPLVEQYQIQSSLICPLIGQDGSTLGLFSLMFNQAQDKKLSDFKLLSIFIRRLTREFEKYLQNKALKINASIPKYDPNPIIQILENGKIIFANESGRRLFKKWERVDDNMRTRLLHLINKVRGTKKERIENVIVNHRPYLFNMRWIPENKQINIYVNDQACHQAAEKDTEDHSHYDSLTNLPNSLYFTEKLKIFHQQHEEQNKPFALMLLNFDDFNNINESFGQTAGDQFLAAASGRIKDCLYKADFLARLSGDQFVLLMPNTNTEKSLVVAEKITNALETPFQIGEQQLENTCSIGIAVYPHSASTEAELLKHAETAVKKAKKNGKNSIVIYDAAQPENTRIARTNYRKDLIKAVRNDEFFLCYQPYFHLETRQIIGFEAFMRWQHPTRGLILPSEFMNIAEKTGIITSAGQWGIDEALSEYSSALSIIKNLTLTLNISALQFSDERFVDMLVDRIQYYHIEPRQIVLDVSENLIESKNPDIKEALARISRYGFKISIDNFGFPAGSLLKLTEMTIDYLKLCGEFIKDIQKFSPKYHLLQGILQMADGLDIRVLQKGVETRQQDLILKDIHCHYVQGNYYCHPLEMDKVIPFIKNHHEKSDLDE